MFSILIYESLYIFQCLTLYKLYDVYEMINKGNINNIDPSKIIFIINDLENIYPYPKERFITLEEWELKNDTNKYNL